MATLEFQDQKLYQIRQIGLAVTAVGGFIDAYTFMQRGGVLAAGQTGNIIFLSVDLTQHDLPGALVKITALLFFALGVALVTLFKHHHFTHYWRILILILETLVCVVIGFLPHSMSNLLVVPPLALVMAMQTTAYSEIDKQGYNNVFSTGNLKKATIALTEFANSHDRHQGRVALMYFEIVGSFAGGAIVSAFLQEWLGIRTIWVIAGVLLLIIGYYAHLLHHKYAL